MGHYSRFEIRFVNSKSDEVSDLLIYLEDKYNFYDYSEYDEKKWYLYKRDFIETSKKFPNITFIVLRTGEARDFECNLFSNGKILDLIPEEYVSDTTKDYQNYFEID